MTSRNLIPESNQIERINSIKDISFIEWNGVFKNSKSKATVKCSIDGYVWNVTCNDLANGIRCPQCSGKRRWTSDERIEQINESAGLYFVEWENGYKNMQSKAIVRCATHYLEWSATVSNLVHNKTGCPKCGRESSSVKRRASDLSKINEINSIEGVKFIKWSKGEYYNCYSTAVVSCESGHEWTASVNNLTSHKSRCPMCSTKGFKRNQKGYLYALRSKCGLHIKIGISGNPKQRYARLATQTPFAFDVIEQIEGYGDFIYRLERHFHNKYERSGFAGFEGATEWLIFTDEILEEIRSIAKC